MSDKPEKIYTSEESNCSGRYWTHSFTSSTEYIRADLAKPSGRAVKRIYCAGNKVSSLFFESKKDALIYQSSAGTSCGIEVWLVDVLPSQIPMEPEAKPSECDDAASNLLIKYADVINRIYKKVKELEWKQKGHHCDCGKACQAIADIIGKNPPEIAKPSEWISVVDRLPEESGSYFVCLENNMVTEFNFSDIGARPYWFKVGFGSEVEENKVIHWQPLPSPPTRETP